MRFNLDYNAGAPPDPEVLEGMREVEEHAWGNPHAQHHLGREAKRVLEDARDRIAACLGVRGDELIFCSGGTEANNMVAFAAHRWMQRSGGRFFASPLEHSSMWEPFGRYREEDPGGCVPLPVSSEGQVDFGRVLEEEGPWFVTSVYGHHELGVVPELGPLWEELGEGRGLHLDLSQSLGRLDLEAVVGKASAFTLSPHKAGGPRGIGVLVWKRELPFEPLLLGGGQELGRRPGTQSPVLAHGAALAIEKALREREERSHRMAEAMAAFLEGIQGLSFEVLGNPNPESFLPNTRTLRFPGEKARDLVASLDLLGLAVSQGSACSSGSTQVSRTLLAMGLSREQAGECLRISLGPEISPKNSSRAASLFSQGLRPNSG